MLDSMRRHANSWVFSLLFAVIIFVFAVNFGPWAGRTAGASPYAAEVNGRVVSFGDFRRAFDDAMRMQQQFNPNFTADLAYKSGMPKKVLESLVQRELLAQLAEKNGVVITDEELVQTITGGQAVEKEFYREFAARQGMTVAEFEAMARRELLAARMRGVILSGLPLSDNDLKTSFFIQKDQVAVDYIRLDPSHFLNQDKKVQSELAQKQAEEIVKELAAGKKIENVAVKDLVKKDKGVSPSAKDVVPVFASTELFSRNDPYVRGIGYVAAELAEAAFQLSESSNFTKQPVIANDKIYILALRERKYPDLSEFAKEKENVKAKVLRDRGDEFFNGFMDQLKKSAKIVYNDAILTQQGGEGPVEG